MQGQIVVHKNKKTQQVEFPVTVEEAVVLKDGSMLSEKLEQVKEIKDGLDKTNAQLSQDKKELSDRIDSIIALPEGSTTADAELMDIRIGADGTKYNSAGSAIRTQIGEVKEGIVHIKNLAKESNSGQYTFEDGGKVSIGNSTNYGFIKIRVVGISSITSSRDVGGAFSLFSSENGTVISRVDNHRNLNKSGYVYKIPSNAVWAYVSYEGDGMETGFPELVILEGETDIATNRYVVSNYPYGQVVHIEIPKFKPPFKVPSKTSDLVNDANFLSKDDTDLSLSFDKVVDVVTNTQDVKDMVAGWACTIDNKTDTSCKITFGTGGFLETNRFASTNDSVMIRLKGSIKSADKGIAISLRYYNSKDQMQNEEIFQQLLADNNKIDFTYKFDANGYNVYKDAKTFSIYMNGIVAKAIIEVDEFYVLEPNDVQKLDIYDKELTKTLKNIDDAIKANEVVPNDVFSVANENGEKYKFQMSGSSLIAIPMIPSKVLALGNSILLGMSNSPGAENFGMCASSSKNDYFYHVKQAILAKNPQCTFEKLHDASFEQCESDNEAQLWFESNKTKFTPDLDLVIIQIGDNVNNDARKRVFKDNFGINLLSKIRKTCKNARVICVGCWYNTSNFDVIRDSASRFGCEVVDIRSLNTVENQGVKGQSIVKDDGSTYVAEEGWLTHPGDSGQLKIAERIIKKIDM